MKLLMLYATTDGQTRRIARHVADRLADLGHGVELIAAAEAGDLDPGRFDRVILAGSLHAGGYQPVLADWAAARAPALNARPGLFLAVSLSAAGDDPEDWAGLNACLAAFLARTGWTPGRVLHVAGAFRFSAYGFFRSWAMTRIAAAKDPSVHPDADREYTDWARLDRDLDLWLADRPAAA